MHMYSNTHICWTICGTGAAKVARRTTTFKDWHRWIDTMRAELKSSAGDAKPWWQHQLKAVLRLFTGMIQSEGQPHMDLAVAALRGVDFKRKAARSSPPKEDTATKTRKYIKGLYPADESSESDKAGPEPPRTVPSFNISGTKRLQNMLERNKVKEGGKVMSKNFGKCANKFATVKSQGNRNETQRCTVCFKVGHRRDNKNLCKPRLLTGEKHASEDMTWNEMKTVGKGPEERIMEQATSIESKRMLRRNVLGSKCCSVFPMSLM